MNSSTSSASLSLSLLILDCEAHSPAGIGRQGHACCTGSRKGTSTWPPSASHSTLCLSVSPRTAFPQTSACRIAYRATRQTHSTFERRLSTRFHNEIAFAFEPGARPGKRLRMSFESSASESRFSVASSPARSAEIRFVTRAAFIALAECIEPDGPITLVVAIDNDTRTLRDPTLRLRLPTLAVHAALRTRAGLFAVVVVRECSLPREIERRARVETLPRLGRARVETSPRPGRARQERRLLRKKGELKPAFAGFHCSAFHWLIPDPTETQP